MTKRRQNTQTTATATVTKEAAEETALQQTQPEVQKEETTVVAEETQQEATTPDVASEPVQEEAQPQEPVVSVGVAAGEISIQPDSKVSPVLVEVVADYIASMAPNKPISDVRVGVQKQRRFAATVVGALATEDRAVFQANMRYLLATINEDKTGVFSEAYLFRLYDSTAWADQKIRREAEAVLTLLVNTAEPNSRSKNARMLMSGEFKTRLTVANGERLTRNLRSFFNIKA